jgi:energy-coupling factor transport system ATP-binding protein
VEREIAFGPRNLGLEPRLAGELVERAIELAGLGSVRAVNPYDLGLSVRKLVALASVLAMEPAVLVLDEPTTGQDGPGADRIGAIVDAYRRAGRTVITVSHDMEFVATHFQRVVVMRQGEIVADGSPEEVFALDRAALLATTGLLPPVAARLGGRLRLGSTPTLHALLGALAAQGR